jgi:hypothetical protein
MSDIKRGFTFTHLHFIDPTFTPNAAAGEKYAAGPKAPMVVSRATRTTVYYKHGRELPGIGGSWCMARDEFEETYGGTGA